MKPKFAFRIASCLAALLLISITGSAQDWTQGFPAHSRRNNPRLLNLVDGHSLGWRTIRPRIEWCCMAGLTFKSLHSC
jgi:hypothetical protein